MLFGHRFCRVQVDTLNKTEASFSLVWCCMQTDSYLQKPLCSVQGLSLAQMNLEAVAEVYTKHLNNTKMFFLT